MPDKRCSFCGSKTISTYGCVDCGSGGFCKRCVKLHTCPPIEQWREKMPVLDEQGNDTGLVAFMLKSQEMN